MAKRKVIGSRSPESLAAESDVAGLIGELSTLIDDARAHVASTANEALTRLYWAIGHRVRTELLNGQRSPYGAQVVSALGKELAARYGRGFSEKSLRRMMQFVVAFPDSRIVATASRQLSWSHFVVLIPIDDPLEREFYLELCRMEHWTVRRLRERIDSMLFARTALSKKPDLQIQQELTTLRETGKTSPSLAFRDPYLLDFLGLADSWSEQDLEFAILRDIERFLLELGAGFAFIERQKRITLDGDDYHLDLLFYHRRMRRLVAIELKIGEFRPSYAVPGAIT